MLGVQDVDWQAMQGGLLELDNRTLSSRVSKKKDSLQNVFEQSLNQSDKNMLCCTPNDVRQFLVWKDTFGKTIVHNINCKHLGTHGEFKIDCRCPRRLASATVENIIMRLVSIFEEFGLGRNWDILAKSGNPASAPLVKEYLKLIKEEQAKAHVLPKQAKPIFLTKVKAMCSFIHK